MPMVNSKHVGEDKIYEDLPASVATKMKTKNRKEDVIHHDLKKNGALVVGSVKDASDSGNVPKENSFQNDGMMGNQLRVDESLGSLSSDRNKRLVARKRTGDEGTKVPGEQSELETKEHKDVSHNDRQYKSKENTLQTGPASKKMRKAGRKDGNGISLIEHGEKATGSDTAISECTYGQKLGNTSSVFDHLNTEFVKQNHLSTADASGGRKKRKRQSSNPGQSGNEVSSAKDVHVAKDKDSVGKPDPDSFLGKRSMGGIISEPCLISPSERQDVSETNKVAHAGEAVDAVHNIIPASGISPAECPIVTVTDMKADDVIQDVLESLKRCDNASENAENTGTKLQKKTKNKSSTVMAPPELQGKDYVDHQDPTFLVHNVTELSASSKSTRKTVNSDSVQLNGTNLGSNQITLERKHDGRSVQDVVSLDHTKSTNAENSNNNKEVPCGSETVKSQQHRDTVDSSEEMLNVDQDKEVKTPAAKASSNQSQRSSSKVEPSSSNVVSSRPLLTIPEIVAKEPPQSKKSAKIDSAPNNAQRPIDVNSSREPFETPKKTINSKKGGSEPQSHVDIAKATGTNSRKVANSLANKKSLFATTVTIFRHDDKESSDDEDGVGNSDSSTRTPSDSSSSSDYSSNSIAKGSLSQNGSCNSEGEDTGGRKKQKPGSSSPKSMSLHAILRNSSSYKKAKLTASQDINSQPEEFVPDSQPAT
ncbi:hypothetical protein F3Y22_tig00111498pilonHSYRG00013 [Hibiscus syriacus]|uniref:Uncharacterized protein n=1 Tax=Hibiscus syriacus TaxID=106335 RepID=A0A6A2Y7U2_HIBSY|nr:hypothetical protein F3Y22_tig00111498pilonHSYRG00013 [Hibiscus syriacus]